MTYRILLNTLFFTVSLWGQNGQKVLPKSYICYQTREPITIDGKVTERSWQQAPWTDDFIDIQGLKTPKYRTRAKMLWDNKNIYFYATLEEPHIWGDIQQRDAVIFYNNDFEIFIDPDGDTHNYYELEINALNTVWDLFLVKPYREHAPVLDNWDIHGLKTAVTIEGTLNDPSDTDKRWNVEIAIPWKALTEAATTKEIPIDHIWRINFSRVNWDFELIQGNYQRKKDPKTGTYISEYNWVWSPQWVINMHEPERWGYVLFSPKKPESRDTFKYDKDQWIKQGLYALYRSQKKHFNKHGTWNWKLPQFDNYPIKAEGKEIIPKIEKNKAGWILSAKSPFTGRHWHLLQDGKIWSENPNKIHNKPR